MQVVLVLGPSTGRIGQHVASLSVRLAEAGCGVKVAGPAETLEQFAFSVPFVPVEITAQTAPVRQLALAGELRALLATADIVHAHGHSAGFVASAARRRTVPLVVSWHTAMLATGAAGVALRGVQRGVARRATVVLGASSDLVEEARRLGALDARLAPVASPPLPPPLSTPGEVRMELGTRDRELILAVGKLTPQKDYDVLLDAAAELAGRADPPLIAIAGDGPERERLEARVEDEKLPVELLGHRSDVAALLSAAEVVVLTSRWEARAVIAQEAMRAGVPLVATAVGGIPELVGDAALLVPPGDGAAVAAALGRVLDEPMLRRRLTTGGPKQAVNWPDEDETAAHILTIYRELTDPRR